MPHTPKDIDFYLEMSSVDSILYPDGLLDKFVERLCNFIKRYFDESEGIGVDIRSDGFTSWDLLGFQIKAVKYSDYLCFDLYILDPIDICISKLARYDPDDISDIKGILQKVRPSEELLEMRFNAYISRLRNPKKADYVRKNFEAIKLLLKTL